MDVGSFKTQLRKTDREKIWSRGLWDLMNFRKNTCHYKHAVFCPPQPSALTAWWTAPFSRYPFSDTFLLLYFDHKCWLPFSLITCTFREIITPFPICLTISVIPFWYHRISEIENTSMYLYHSFVQSNEDMHCMTRKLIGLTRVMLASLWPVYVNILQKIQYNIS